MIVARRYPRRMRRAAKVLLGLALVGAGISHLTVARTEFQAQVPAALPMDADDVVVWSGVAEIALGSALLLAPARAERTVGRIAAGFFTAIFPGNVEQFAEGRDGFGLDTDGKRFARLFFQPVLVAWALWSTRGRR